MNTSPKFSDGEIERLRNSTLFNGLPDSVLGKFLEAARRIECKAGGAIYVQGSKTLQFTAIIDGCVAVWDDSYGEDTIDALLTRGQVCGEFEFLGYPGHSYELRSLADTVAARVESRALRRLIDSLDLNLKANFLENLSKTLVEKLRVQNTMLKFRTDEHIRRLAKLFNNFSTEEWHYLTDQEDRELRNSYEINLLFTRKVLLGLIEGGDGRGLGPAFGSLIHKKIIAFCKYNDERMDIGAAESSEFGNSKKPRFPDCRYFSINVLDSDRLSEYTLGENLRKK